MKKSIKDIQLDIIKLRQLNEISKYLESIDGLKKENYYYFNSSEKYTITFPETLSVLDNNECLVLIQKDYDDRKGFMNYFFKRTLIYPHYILDVCAKLKLTAQKIDRAFLEKFKNPFIQDELLVKKYNLSTNQMSIYFHTIDDSQYQKLVEEFKAELDKRF